MICTLWYFFNNWFFSGLGNKGWIQIWTNVAAALTFLVWRLCIDRIGCLQEGHVRLLVLVESICFSFNMWSSQWSHVLQKMSSIIYWENPNEYLNFNNNFFSKAKLLSSRSLHFAKFAINLHSKLAQLFAKVIFNEALPT